MLQNNKIIKKTVKLSLLGLCLILLGSCRSGSQKNVESPICNPQLKLRAPLSTAFDLNKIQLDQTHFGNQGQNLKTLEQSQEQSGEVSLALVVKNDCIQALEEPLYVLGNKVEIPEDLKDLDQSALSFTVQQPIDEEQLKKDMDQSPCLIGISEDHPVELIDPIESQGNPEEGLIQKNFNDPEAENQDHLRFLNVSKSLEIQNHVSEQVIVAVLDTGVNYNHPDLRRRMWTSILGDYGKDFTRTSKPSPNDDDGHGTHVAGIIGAQQDNGFGVAGLLSGFIKIMAVKVLGGSRSRSRESSVFNGIQYAVNRGADVINISLGEDRINVLTVTGVLTAVNAGVFFSLAAGNDSSLLTGTRHRFPASVGTDIGGAVTVASVDTETGNLSSFSNYSSKFVEIAAPGAEKSYGSPTRHGILSTELRGRYSRRRGTSMAAPMVSAAAALLIGYFKTNNISYTPAGVEKTLLLSGSRSVEDLKTKVQDGRVLDFGRLADSINGIENCK